DGGMPIEAACRIVVLEDQLEEAQQLNAAYRREDGTTDPTAAA
ncbi:MerR family transcriptional regulator, partial [Streptomyces sp. NPDC095817]